jgi:hypothetical protein
MGFNFGAFAGGVSQGIDRGMKLADFLKKAREEQDQRKALEDANSDFEKQRAAKAADMAKGGVATAVQPAGAQPAVAETTQPVRVPVSPSEFGAEEAPTASQDAASAATAASSMPPSAQASAPEAKAEPSQQQVVAGAGVQPVATKPAQQPKESEDDILDQKISFISKRMRENMILRGDLEGAEKWGKWSESSKGKQAATLYAKAATAPDLETMAINGTKLHELVDDGLTSKFENIVTKSDGSQVAIVNVTDKATGKVNKMEMTKEAISRLVMRANPEAMYRDDMAKQQEAEKIKLQHKLKAQERAEKRADDAYLEGLKQAGQEKRDNNKSKNTMDEIALREELKADFDNKFQKAKSDEERSHITRQYLATNNPKWKRMSEDERATEIASEMRSSIKAAKQISEEKGGKPSAAKDAPATGIAEKPMAYDPKLPVKYNKQTGKPHHYIDGQYVPIEGKVPAKTPAAKPSAAAGLPPAQQSQTESHQDWQKRARAEQDAERAKKEAQRQAEKIAKDKARADAEAEALAMQKKIADDFNARYKNK